MYRVATDVGGTFTDLVYFEIDKSTGKALKIKTAKSEHFGGFINFEFNNVHNRKSKKRIRIKRKK